MRELRRLSVLCYNSCAIYLMLYRIIGFGMNVDPKREEYGGRRGAIYYVVSEDYESRPEEPPIPYLN